METKTTNHFLMRILASFLVSLSFYLSFSQNYSYSSIPENLLKDADAVMRVDEIDIQIEALDKMTYTTRQVITVLNESGDGHARTRVFYDKEKKIKKIEAFVYDAFGKEIDHIKKKDFKDLAAVDGFSLYTDDRLLYYKYIPAQYPYTIEFKYEVETSDTGIFPQWYFISGYEVSVEDSRYAITYPSQDLKPVIKEENLSNITFHKEEGSNKIVYTSENIVALKAENASPPFGAFCPKLAVRLPNFHYKGYTAKIDDWKEMGLWINEKLLAGRTKLEQGTVDKVKMLVNGVEDDLEKAKIIYQYVQNNTRYISVQIGIGGFQPISAIEVDKVKYGDCKGLSNYTRALLEAVGVTSYYVVVQAGNTKVDFEEEFADLIQGNHVILAIPYNDEYYWVDCTSQVHPFGFIGDFTDDRKVLLVKPEGGELVKTISYINEDNSQKMRSKYRILEDHSIEGEVIIETRGVQYDNRFYIERKSKEDIIEHYRDFWSNINGLDVTEYSFENNKDEVVFVEKVKLRARDYASESGDDLIVNLNAFNNNSHVPPRYRNRKLPFRIQRGFLNEAEFIVQIPKNFQVADLPEKFANETRFGTYEVEISKKGEGELLYKRKLLIKKGDYPKEEYGNYRLFKRTIAKHDNQKIILIHQNQ